MRSLLIAIGGAALALCALAAVRPLAAQQRGVPEWLDRLTVGGRGYLRWSDEIGDYRSNFNEFDIDRIYLQLQWRLSERTSIRHTFEGGDLRESGTDYFDVATKHFFLEIQDPLYSSTYLRLGLADLPWVPYEEGLWGYRFQGTVFPDRSGYLTSTDLGMALGGNIPRGYGSWQVNVVNGEGWKREEAGKHKDVHARLTLNPLAGAGAAAARLFVAAFAATGTYDGVTAGPDERSRYIAQVGYVHPRNLTLVAEYLAATDPAARMRSRYPSLDTTGTANARGYSVFGVMNLGLLNGTDAARRWELVGRLDHLDPDRSVADNELDRVIVGVSYRWNAALQGLVALEQVDYGAAAQRSNERRVMLQAEVRF